MRSTGFRPSHRKQQMWVCIIAGLFVCDFILCGYRPSQQRLTSLQQARAQQRRTISMAAAQSEELPALRAKVRETMRIVESFDSYVPSDSALGAFLQRATTVMTECGLTDQVILPGKPTEADDLGCLPIHIAGEGTLTNVFDFFRKVQTLDRLVRVEKVTLENEPDFNGQLAMQAEVMIFYQSKSSRTQGPVTGRPTSGAGNGA